MTSPGSPSATATDPGGVTRASVRTALIVGTYLPALTAMRTLAAEGYRVIIGDGGEFSTAGLSRDCDEVWLHPSIGDTEGFLTALLEFLELRPEVSVVLPLLEAYVALLTEHRDRLPEHIILAAPDATAVHTCRDKRRMYEIAGEVGVPYRPLGVAHDLDSLGIVADEIGYPCVVRSSGGGRQLRGRGKAVILRDRASLDRLFHAWPEGHPDLLVQRYVAGSLHAIQFIARRGKILAAHENKALRYDRADRTGLAVAWVTVAPDPERMRHLASLVDRLDYTGIGNGQFLVPDVGAPHFLEINPRHGAAYGMAERSGLRLTMAAIELAGEVDTWPADREFRYETGRLIAWTSRDLYGLGVGIARREIDMRSALRWFVLSMSVALRADMHLTWSVRDPMPTLATYIHLATLGRWRPRPKVAPPRAAGPSV